MLIRQGLIKPCKWLIGTPRGISRGFSHSATPQELARYSQEISSQIKSVRTEYCNLPDSVERLVGRNLTKTPKHPLNTLANM